MIVPFAANGILDNLDGPLRSRLGRVKPNCYDIDPKSSFLNVIVMGAQVFVSQFKKARTFDRRNAFEGGINTFYTLSCAAAHFDKHQFTLLSGDKVQFANRTAPIVVYEFITRLGERP